MSLYNVKSSFIKENGELNIEKVLQRFQQFMKEQYSSKDEEFVEQHGRLLFLAFIKPIINGTGFDFKEVQISEEKSGIKNSLKKRNKEIFNKYKSGVSVRELSEQFYLTEDSIRRIIREEKQLIYIEKEVFILCIYMI